ncbi:peroxisomal membrane protein 11B isoform X1 [Thrips palmi]|uniref:Peroxisomal membrane protein 11B isoform X1 n=2 Tax=Thrips palmi TaxID=161013 RepID=A0A6P8Z0S5_THRPL|nr:peroxisomal membrane protein 11B isoform X1 [Thrips palmi]
METLIKLNNQAAGRDKMARILQYGSRALWFYMQQKKMNHQTIEKLRALEFTFSSFRKLLRLGKCVDVMYSALSSIHYPNITVRVTTTLSRISMSLYLLADHILWIGRTGLCAVNGEKWGKVANKYWMYALLMNLVRDIYEIHRILKLRQVSLSDFFSDGCDARKKLATCARDHRDVIVDTVKNACDVVIPLTALGFLNFSPGSVGLCGVVSSAAALLTLIDPLLKLTPS